jgi:oligopeptide transport system substrate-binding protein
MWRCTIIFLLLLGTFSCSKQQENVLPKKSIKINIVQNPSSLDPRNADASITFTLSNMLYEGLTRISPQGDVTLAGAREVNVSEDGLTYIFNLRKTKWSNDVEVTSHDYERAWKSMLTPSFSSPYIDVLYTMKNAKKAKEGKVSLNSVGVKALDDTTLEVTLEHPTPYFLELVSLPILFPINSKMTQYKFSDPYDDVINNGPFKLVFWDAHNAIQVEKNIDYWDSENVHIDIIDMVMLEKNFEAAMFKKGKLDWLGSPISTLPVSEINELKKQFELHQVAGFGSFVMLFNTSTPPFNNIKIRKAFSYAIDRDALIKKNNIRALEPTFTPVPPAFSLLPKPDISNYTTKKAQQLFEEGIKELGITRNPLSPKNLVQDGQDIPIRIYSSFDHRYSEYIQKSIHSILQQWKDTFGINIGLENMNMAILYDRLHKNNFQIASKIYIEVFADPIAFLNWFRPYQNETYNNLLSQAETAENKEERLKYLLDAENFVVDEMLCAPVFSYQFCYFKNPALENVHVAKSGYLDFKWAYIYD